MHKNKTQSERDGKGSFHFAWVMDSSEEERKRGVTIDVVCWCFFSKNNVCF